MSSRTSNILGPVLVGCAYLLVLAAEPALAIQVHDSSEGLCAHQIAHVFFLFSMGTLIYWLRERNLVRETGWRFIQFSALFFILWNLGAFISHFFEAREELMQMIKAGFWKSSVVMDRSLGFGASLFYLSKMDHLVLLPAIIFLYAGLRHLLDRAQKSEPPGRSEP